MGSFRLPFGGSLDEADFKPAVVVAGVEGTVVD